MDNKDDVRYLEALLKPLVKNSEDIKIERSVDDMGVLLRLSVNKEDMGGVIGKEGEHIKAIRLVVKLYGMNHGSRINLKLEEPVAS